MTYECFQSLGHLDCCKEALIMDVRGSESSGANSLYKRIRRSSYVEERLGFRICKR